jgi:hypothetical protein
LLIPPKTKEGEAEKRKDNINELMKDVWEDLKELVGLISSELLFIDSYLDNRQAMTKRPDFTFYFQAAKNPQGPEPCGFRIWLAGSDTVTLFS